jgi:hypothetical protein
MTQPLIAEALSQSWGIPNPHNQIILRPARLTPINGVNRRFKYAWHIYGLPNNTSYFHVYQTGQIAPTLIDLFEATSSWQLLSDACNDTNAVIDLYTQLGLKLPLTRAWYRWIDKKNIFIAVEINTKIPAPWPELEMFMRLYKNSFFDSDLAGVNDRIEVAGGVMTSTSDVSSLTTQAAAITNADGYNGALIGFVNGVRVSTLNPVTVHVGDVAEYLYDTSVYKIVDFAINSLPTFQSTLDHKAKRLLHYDSSDEALIDFEMNNDYYLVDAVSGKGVYIHKNNEDTVRQLTHKDYAIASDYLPPYYVNFQNSQGAVNTANLRVRMFVRYSGQGLMPKMEANFYKFMMDMSGLNQVQAMVGINAAFPLWKAANLEASPFMQLLRSKRIGITQDLVERAYGYYRVNSVLGQSILKPVSGQITLPPAFQSAATAFEYNSSGVLLGSYSFNNDLIYFPTNGTCAVAEFVEGSGGSSIDEYYGSDPVTLDPTASYRFYLKVQDAELNVPVWQDVTGTTYYSITDGVAYWGNNAIPGLLDRMVRSDKKFLDYNAVLNLDGGLMTHQINYNKITTRGTINSPLEVPLGELDVWLNNHPLVRGVDYILNFPTISILNKQFLVYAGSGPNYQALRVRMTGFCDPSIQVNPLDEVGFIFNGVLSANGHHDLHREKVQRIVINGALTSVDDIYFLEDGSNHMVSGGPLEGKPYEVRDVINRLNGLIVNEPYALYRATRANAIAAEDYATQNLPEVVAYPVSPIVNKYQIYSPFLAKIIVDLVASYIDLTNFTVPYSDATVRSLCAPYLYLLPLDPIGPANLPDARYTVIHPHPFQSAVTLSVLQYAFFERVIAIFAGDKVVYSTLVVLP